MPTGLELLRQLGRGQHLRISHGNGKVHKKYLDRRRGEERTCRLSMLDRKPGRNWRAATAAEFAAKPSEECSREIRRS